MNLTLGPITDQAFSTGVAVADADGGAVARAFSEMLAEIEERATSRNVECTCRCCHGTPHDEVVDYADEVDADVIVMGYRGQSHEERMGSVVDRVLRETDRPVLAV